MHRVNFIERQGPIMSNSGGFGSVSIVASEKQLLESTGLKHTIRGLVLSVERQGLL